LAIPPFHWRAMAQHHIDIHHVAKLARLKLSDAEAETYGRQLDHVLAYMAVLEKHDLDAAMPTAHAEAVFDVWRNDEPRDGFTNVQALANAPKKSQGQFQMPRVVEE
jgi:aspartyl-tRNA(Asn)/glutamyl-tRNA(Gln) amidotransferase subunit C